MISTDRTVRGLRGMQPAVGSGRRSAAATIVATRRLAVSTLKPAHVVRFARAVRPHAWALDAGNAARRGLCATSARNTNSSVPSAPSGSTLPAKRSDDLAEHEQDAHALWDIKLGSVLGHESLSVTRAHEWGSIIAGFEQARKFTLHNTRGEVIGYMAEEGGAGRAIARQLLRTHRKFEATVFNTEGEIVLKIVRPVYLLSSSMYVETGNGEPLGEVHMHWHLLRRRYDLYTAGHQFSRIDQPMLSWDFRLLDDSGAVRGGVNKNWRGFGTELFTDAGQYVVHFSGAAEGLQPFAPVAQDGTQIATSLPAVVGDSSVIGEPLNLLERAVTLACAVTIDNDYFSKRSGGGFMPFFFPMPAPIPPADAPPADGAGGDSSGEVGTGGSDGGDLGGRPGAPDPSGAAADDTWDESVGGFEGANDQVFSDENDRWNDDGSSGDSGSSWGGGDDSDDFSSGGGGGEGEGWDFAGDGASDEGSGILGTAWDVVSGLFED